ncbi:MAG: DUF3261 domain-containing protein, partial [Deltaproteobacteria bacterium]|nr:DUF3261 domain-containing protein [Deltaproteobacteria bacterium]
MPDDIELRGRMHLSMENGEAHFEVVARRVPEELVVVGIAQYGVRLFAVHQRGREIAVEGAPSREFEHLARWTLDALHRAIWISRPSDPGAGPVVNWSWENESVTESIDEPLVRLRSHPRRRRHTRAGRRMSGRARRGYPVTAWSTVNSLGTSNEQVVSALRCGRPSLVPPPLGAPIETVCGVVDIDLPALPKGLERFDSRNSRFVQQALAEIGTALDAARERWGTERVGICVGSSTAAMDKIENAYNVHAETGSLPS